MSQRARNTTSKVAAMPASAATSVATRSRADTLSANSKACRCALRCHSKAQSRYCTVSGLYPACRSASSRSVSFSRSAMSIRSSLISLAIVLTACAQPKPPADLPPELPHYPCQRKESGKTVYFKCSALEWVEQQNPKKERP